MSAREALDACTVNLSCRSVAHLSDCPQNHHSSPPGRSADEVRVTSETGGEKGQKPERLGSIDPQALLTLAAVAGFGEQKYARLNYLKGYPWSLSFDALQRHLLAFWSGQDLDEESGLPHVAHAAWHCLALLAFMHHDLGTDDRYRPQQLVGIADEDYIDRWEKARAAAPAEWPPPGSCPGRDKCAALQGICAQSCWYARAGS